MVPKRYRELYEHLACSLERYEEFRPLPGLEPIGRRSTLLQQMVDSVRRTEYPKWLTERGVSPLCADPATELFHPLKAAVHFKAAGEVEEAFWMLFLYVHFGKHHRSGWSYVRAISGGMATGDQWTWRSVSANPEGFRNWLNLHEQEIRSESPSGGFGNHRKYESLKAYGKSGTGAVVQSYVEWVGPPRSHEELVSQAFEAAENDPRQAFRSLYASMKHRVLRFGRLACIDYLGTAGKLGLAAIEPDSAYLRDSASGPLKGARLLFGLHERARVLDEWLLELDAEVDIGPRVLEDALCNWQKSPSRFKKFSA